MSTAAAPVGAGALSNTPYTVTVRRQMAVRGEARDHVESLVAVRSDGARARVVTSPRAAANGEVLSRTLELPDGLLASYYPAVRAQSTGYQSRAMVESDRGGRLTAESRCTAPAVGRVLDAVKVEGEERMWGVRVVRVVLEAGRMRSVRWMAPELGCLELRKRVEWRGTGGEVESVMEEEAVDLRLGEPARALFEPPAGYDEVMPSEADARMAKLLGRPCPECVRERGGNKDRAYGLLARTRQF